MTVQWDNSASGGIRRMLHKHMTATLPDDHEPDPLHFAEQLTSRDVRRHYDLETATR